MSKIKLFGLIPPKPGMSSEEFHDYYRHPHGTLGRHVSTLRNYCQSHQIDCELLGDSQRDYQAVAEIWVDGLADVQSFREEPLIVSHMIDDEKAFVDTDNLLFFAGREEILVSGPDARDTNRHPADAKWSVYELPNTIKLLVFYKAGEERGWQAAQSRELCGALGAFRHVCCSPVKEVHGSDSPFIGACELWWPTLTAFKHAAAGSPEAFNGLIANAANSVALLAHCERFI